MAARQLASEPLLNGGLGLLLAPFSAVTEAELPAIIKQMEQRLSRWRGSMQALLRWGAGLLGCYQALNGVCVARAFTDSEPEECLPSSVVSENVQRITL